MMSQVDTIQAPREVPLYNIGAVSRMTGIPMATLRIWERRYGFPHSARTAGGHRLYSERDVVGLRWVKARTEEGMQAGQAVRALQHVQEEGRFPQVPVVSALASHQEMSVPSLDAFRQNLTAALLAHDTNRGDQLLGEATAIYPLDNIILDGIVPSLSEIGKGWLEGRVDVATEHLATNYVRHRLVMWTLTGPPTFPIRPVMLACAPEELHEGGLLILGVLLRRRRWPVAYLGQTVPLTDLSKLAQDMRPPAIVFVASTEKTAEALSHWPRYLPGVHEARRPIVAFGGRIFTEQPEWRDKVPGTFLGATLQEGVDKLEGLLRDATSLIV
jgi:DNA-binding transcriptional MerR regulator